MVGTVLAGSLVGAVLTALIQSIPSNAQGNVVEEILPVQASVLVTIREAPLRELFSVTTASGETAYGVKDKDFDPSYERVGFYSLWGDVPDQNLLQVAVLYCFRDRALTGSELEEIVLMDGDETLVTLNQKLVTTRAQNIEISPARSYQTYADPFYYPYWGGIYYGTSGFGGTGLVTSYLPAAECSFGGGRFDLLPVKDAIAQLPNKTLNVKLLFSNGLVENWRLGRGTVENMKELPTLQ